MGRKHLFSLIEIAVALAVAAIGVASIMALLPIAVKATSDSVGDTLAADVANTVIAQLDRIVWEEGGFEYLRKNTDFPENKPTSAFGTTVVDGYLKQFGEKSTEDSYLILPKDGLKKGHFVFMFGPKSGAPDFSAEVYCWRDSSSSNLPLTRRNGDTGEVGKINSHTINHNGYSPLVRIYVEITWPLTKKYGTSSNRRYVRQSRTFVREYVDPTYYKGVEN
ncbi:MAG: hypothetical protein IKQ16_07575 [Lentisphaeria bacterium]|nr:hypothetical protein [Lentisphaeria bacterium]